MRSRIAILGLLLGTSAGATDGPLILWAADSGVPRANHGAALLPDGRVMVQGYYTTSTQLYDPANDAWIASGDALGSHSNYSLARFRDGTLVVVDNSPVYEWWSPATGTWSAGPPGAPRQTGVALLLSSGTLLTGCGDDGSSLIGSFERYDPDAGAWIDAGAQFVPTRYCAISPLPGDRWLKTGGTNPAPAVAELWYLNGGGQPIPALYQRSDHTSTVLTDGRVLLTGGAPGGAPVPVELFDPVSELWLPIGAAPSKGRRRASATVLPDGRVLVAGGDDDTAPLDTAELFDPFTGLWSATFQLGTRRSSHLAVMLANGRVLLTGGTDGTVALESSELIDFSAPFVAGAPAPSLPIGAPRLGAARGAPILWDDESTAAYRLDSQGRWVALPPAPANPGAVAVTLADGRLLRVGAALDGYDLERDTWFTLPGPDGGHARAAASLVRTGEVLIAGGDGPSSAAVLYDPRTATWSATENLPIPTRDAQAVTLPNGDVLVCGGETATGVTEWCWVYTTSTRHWTFAIRLPVARRRFSLTVLENGRALAVGGENDAGLVDRAEVIDPSTISLVPVASPLEPRSGHAALRLRNGRVLVIGGGGASGALATTELFEPLTGEFRAGPPLGVPFASPVVAMTAEGQVLIAGAEDGRLERFDEGRGALPIWAPVLDAPPPARPGGVVTVTGARLTGVTPGSSGNLRDSPSDLPVLALVRADGVLLRPGALSWTPSSVTFRVPPAASTGWLTLSASVNGIEGAAQPFMVGLGEGQRCDAGVECAAGACSGGVCVPPPQTAVSTPDSGSQADAGGEEDAGSTPDAGSPSALSVECGCASAPAGMWVALLFLLLGLSLRRQRRSRPNATFRP